VREVEAGIALDHPNIVPIIEAGEIGPVCYIASEFCRGPTLAEWLESQGCMPGMRAALLVAALADAGQHAHDRGILHRDLEAICLKCLEKNPSRRYLRAADLAADLRRFASGGKVTARPVSWGRNAVAWLKRHPTSFVAMLITIVATLLFSGEPRGLGERSTSRHGIHTRSRAS
jgi:hypothetical protein